ncbi:MAG: glutamate 5-kinase [Spirochaetaceae bacterium]|jgi:glutamate 5-kinase|nr:glutamate 5-kinase [Spirochaetaceae bacterium]
MIEQLIERARKILVKIGSNTLADESGHVNHSFLDDFAGSVNDLVKKGKQIVIVSSGAQIAGLSIMGRWARKQDIHYRQALCAVGQVELMRAWSAAFAQQGLSIAQLLLTRADFSDSLRTLNMRNTLFTLVDEGIIPIINENDSVCVDEIKIGDNDTLAALSAILWSADLLLLFSNIDGLYTKNPQEHPDAQLVTEVRDLAAVKTQISMEGKSFFGTGGIATKYEAAERVLAYGIPMILAHGGRHKALSALAEGTQSATAFIPAETA